MTVEQLVAVDLAQVGVRTDPSFLPFESPEPNTATTWVGRDVLWLGPDEWLVIGEPEAAPTIERELKTVLAGHHHSVIDVSANRIVFDLEDGLDLLTGSCGLDLDPRRWRPGMCAQTLFGAAQVVLHQLDARTTRVFVRPSFVGYVVERFRSAVA